MNENQPKPSDPTLIQTNNVPEVTKLLAALGAKHGPGAAIVGLHRANLHNIIAVAFHPENTKMTPEAREATLKLANIAVEEFVRHASPLFHVCCQPHLDECTKAFSDLAGHTLNEMFGEKGLETTEAAAKEAIAVAAGQAGQ